jgi:transcriptional regulator with XRE-family HTH domain
MPHKSTQYAGDRALVALGGALRDARKQKGLSQEALAVDAELERSYLGAIERGEVNLTVMALTKICRELKVKPSAMLECAGM